MLLIKCALLVDELKSSFVDDNMDHKLKSFIIRMQDDIIATKPNAKISFEKVSEYFKHHLSTLFHS